MLAHSTPMSGLDVNLTLVEPFLPSFVDGPFTVYDQRRCRVQLNFEVPREVRKDRAKALAADGQHVAWANHLAQALQECYLEGGN